MQQGYMTLALGSSRYYEMAINLAISAKVMDRKRPICLVHDHQYPMEKLREYFDQLVPAQERTGFVGCANKLLIYDLSPYEETMFVDSDCLILKGDMDRHWAKMRAHAFNIAGVKRTTGIYGGYGIDIARVCKELAIPYMATGNSGVIYFRKSDLAKNVFAKAQEVFNIDVLRRFHGQVQGQVADEPAFGVAMGAMHIEPVEYDSTEGTVMTATWRARRTKADLTLGDVRIEKPVGGFRLFNRFFPKQWIVHRPTILHFIGLKPNSLYRKLVLELRARLKKNES